VTEQEAIQVFLDYLKKAGRGSWEATRGPEPPDFVIVNPQTSERAAVEHTRFFWPPEEQTFGQALQSVKRDVNERIMNRVRGLFGASIDHENRQAFSSSFDALARAKRSNVSKWLAGQIETVGPTMAVRNEMQLDGPLPCTLIRYSDFGRGQMAWLRSMSMGSDLGIKLKAAEKDGSWHSFVERLERPDTVLYELEAVLRRKAESLKLVDYGGRMLLIEYYASLLDTLKYIMTVLDVPQTIDELYFLVFPGPEVARWQGGDLDAA
jgi:hypothetical protein